MTLKKPVDEKCMKVGLNMEDALCIWICIGFLARIKLLLGLGESDHRHLLWIDTALLHLVISLE